MEIIAYTVSEALDLRPARATRVWMDDAINKNPYRCLPLIVANSYGWELLSRCEITAEWDGSPAVDAVKIQNVAGTCFPVSHFGEGVLTWHTGYLFRTEFPYGLYVTGAPNQPTHNVVALSGVVETHWLPFPFTMNWKFTAPGRIKIKPGDPVSQIFPVRLDMFSDVQAKIKPISENPDLEAQYREWSVARRKFNAGSRGASDWQKHYFRGVSQGGEKIAEHKTNLNVPAFEQPTR